MRVKTDCLLVRPYLGGMKEAGGDLQAELHALSLGGDWGQIGRFVLTLPSDGSIEPLHDLVTKLARASSRAEAAR